MRSPSRGEHRQKRQDILNGDQSVAIAIRNIGSQNTCAAASGHSCEEHHQVRDVPRPVGIEIPQTRILNRCWNRICATRQTIGVGENVFSVGEIVREAVTGHFSVSRLPGNVPGVPIAFQFRDVQAVARRTRQLQRRHGIEVKYKTALVKRLSRNIHRERFNAHLSLFSRLRVFHHHAVVFRHQVLLNQLERDVSTRSGRHVQGHRRRRRHRTQRLNRQVLSRLRNRPHAQLIQQLRVEVHRIFFVLKSGVASSWNEMKALDHWPCSLFNMQSKRAIKSRIKFTQKRV